MTLSVFVSITDLVRDRSHDVDTDSCGQRRDVRQIDAFQEIRKRPSSPNSANKTTELPSQLVGGLMAIQTNDEIRLPCRIPPAQSNELHLKAVRTF
jgi:hypothetical protein